jgi:beta-glucanase (GH16 family)
MGCGFCRTPSTLRKDIMNLRKLGALALVTISLFSASGSASAKVQDSAIAAGVLSKKVTLQTKVTLTFVDATKTALKPSKISVSPKSARLAYQWLRDGKAIRGATKSTFKLTSADYDSELRLKITASSSGYSPVTISSATFVPGDQPNKTYKLLWADEFDTASSGPNSSNWVPQNGDGTEYGIPGWGNNELQSYTSKQATVADGVLSLNATRTGASTAKCYYGECEWLSSKFVTKGKVGFQYGRLEARIKTSLGQGVWPAFWLLGANVDNRPWPGCGEIDIMELKGQQPETVWGTIHGPNGSTGGTGATASTDVSGWHDYAVEWSPTAITWFIDGKRFEKITKRQYVGEQDPRVWVFDHEFYLIVNLAMGGNFVGGPPDADLTTASAQIDFIRYYSMDGFGQLTNH